uniref:Reverse transcriptase zinc-binding domain-containing protein n=1 Tax=Setaria viridis TaxID=4556 RepID=A0A4U6VXN1_SETVI|nr:hypothetical protein SEVIR_2G327000v2 [Setaria viridis]
MYMFNCKLIRAIETLVGQCLGANNIPCDVHQYKGWIRKWLPQGDLKCRNRACFDKKIIKNPVEIIFHACSFMTYWAGLYKTDLQEKLLDGVKVLLSCAHKVLAQQARPPPPALLPPIQEDREEDAT